MTLEISLFILGFAIASIATRILLYKVIHPYITVPYLNKKQQRPNNETNDQL